MQITTANIDGGATSFEINSPVGTPSGELFRHTINLSFKTNGEPDRIVVDESATNFGAQFSGQTYNVLDDSSPIKVLERTHEEEAQAVIVTLNRPWEIKRILLTFAIFGKHCGEAYVTGSHFVPTEMEDLTGAVGSSSWACALPREVKVSGDAVAFEDKAIYLMQERMVKVYRVDGDAIADQPTLTAGNGEDFSDAFISERFAIKATDIQGNPKDLKENNIAQIWVQTYPTGPRIGVAEPVDSIDAYSPSEFFWQLPGELRNAAQVDAVNEKAGEALAAALQRYLDAFMDHLREEAEKEGQQPAIPDCIDVALVLESDAPCSVDLDFGITYWLVRESFPIPHDQISPPDKQVLRFNGEKITTQTINVVLARDADVQSVALNMDLSFGRQPSTPLGNDLQAILTDRDRGVSIRQNRWVAQRVKPGKAISVSGVALGLMALEAKAEILVELQEDWNGIPSGKKLAQASILLADVGKPSFVRVDFHEKLTLYTQDYWILAKTAKGSALWITRPKTETTVKVFRASGEQTPVGYYTEIEGVKTFYTFFSRSTSALAENPPLYLAVGDVPLETVSMEDETLWVESDEFRAALNTYLDNSSLEGTSIPIPISFTTAVPGIITVYPPHIEFEMSS